MIDSGRLGSGSRRRWLTAPAWMAAGACIVSIVWIVSSSGSSHPSAPRPTIVGGVLNAVQTASPGEFPTPVSAIRYLVEQVRTQNVEGATRVIPIASFYAHETFAWRASWLESLDFSSFFPGQPLSKLEVFGLDPLRNVYTNFGVDLLVPEFKSTGTIVFQNPREVARVEAMLDPKRLSKIYVKSAKIGARESGAKMFGPHQDPKVTAVASVTTIIGGIGNPQKFYVQVIQIGTNWLIDEVSTS